MWPLRFLFLVTLGAAVSACDEGCHNDSDCSGGRVCYSDGRCDFEPYEECPPCLCGDCTDYDTPCTTDDDCGSGMICDGRYCDVGSRRLCASNADCEWYAHCDGSLGYCVDGATACVTHGDCPPARLCTGTCFPSTLCTEDTGCPPDHWCDFRGTCVPHGAADCRGDADCAADAVCIEGSCRELGETCHFDRECPLEMACVNNACTSACAADDDCRTGELCERGFCRAAEGECASSGDCASGVCVAGRCLAPCANEAGAVSCLRGPMCATEDDCYIAHLSCTETAGGPTCVQTYSNGTTVDGESCTTAFDCSTVPLLDSCTEGTCLGCSAGACDAGLYCDDFACRPEWRALAPCAADGECAIGSVCRSGVCRTPCPTTGDGECAADPRAPRCVLDTASGEHLCFGVNELSSGCRRRSDCALDQDCRDGVCATAEITGP